MRSCEVHTNCSLGNVSKDIPQPMTSTTKLVDVGLYSSVDNNILAQFEVVSSQDYDGTLMKLAYGLCDQLRFVMNHQHSANTITSVKGFIIPVCKTESRIEIVECLWKNSSLSFEIMCRIIQETDICTTIVEVAQMHRNHYDLIREFQNMRICFPIVIDDNIWK